MPFMITMCSRDQNLNFGNSKVEDVTKTNIHESISTNYFSYLLYPTEYSISGFGITINIFINSIKDQFKFNFLQLVPLAFITSILGLIFTFYQKPRFIFYLSLLNLTCFIVLTFIAIWASMLDNSLKDFFDFVLWGFWFSLVLSIIDIILTKKYADNFISIRHFSFLVNKV